MISYFRYWISKNKANNKHFYDGHYWTYNSMTALSKIMPFWSEKQIRTIINSLIDKGIIIEGNYNKAGYDRTKWYAFADEAAFLDICQNGQMEVAKWANGNDQMGKPIPVSIPISKPIRKKENNKKKESFTPPSLEEVEEYCKERNNKVDAKQFFDYYNEGNWKDYKGNPIKNWKQKIIAVWEKKAEEQYKEEQRKEKKRKGSLLW
jgi:hypothetical protein